MSFNEQRTDHTILQEGDLVAAEPMTPDLMAELDARWPYGSVDQGMMTSAQYSATYSRPSFLNRYDPLVAAAETDPDERQEPQGCLGAFFSLLFGRGRN